jgi:glycosyltransferase involved in cell wall biosynthesis
VKVLLVVHGFPPEQLGGTELHTAALAESLAEAGHEVFVFAANRHYEPERRLVRDRDRDGLHLRVVDVPITEDFALTVEDSWVRSKFERYLDEVTPDVVHVQHLLYLGFDLIEAAKLRGIPVAVTLHDFWFQCPRTHSRPSDRHPFRGRLWGLACARHAGAPSLARVRGLVAEGRVRETLRAHLARPGRARVQLDLADAVLTPSEFVRERFVRFGVARDKLVVVPNPVAVGALGEQSGPEAPIDFGFVGSIAPAKGVHVLCEAFARVDGDSRLRIFGRSDDAEYLEALTPFFGSRVRYEGEFPAGQIDEVYGRFDVLVVPSLVEESFSLVAAEAQAFGRPVIASRIGALPEIVHHEQNGLLVAPGDAGPLAEALRRLQDVACARQLGASARRPDTPERYAVRMEEIYSGVIGARAPRRGRPLARTNTHPSFCR